MKKIFLIIITLILLFITYNFYEVYKFRKQPSRSYFISQFGEDSNFMNYFNRYLILYKGRKLYTIDINYFLESIKLNDDNYNRKTLKEIAIKKNNNIFFRDFFSYQFKNDLIEEWVKRLSNMNNCFLLDKNYLEYDYRYRDMKQDDTIKSFENYSSVYDKEKFHNLKSIEVKEKLSNCAYMVYNNLNLITSQLEKETPDYWTIQHNLFLHLQTDTSKSRIFLKDKLIKSKKILPIFIIKYLDSDNIEESTLIKNYLLKNIGLYTRNEIGTIGYSLKKQTITQELFEKIALIDEEKALSLFHAIIEIDLSVAEKISKKYINSKDSILKKGIIALLIRHDSFLGQQYIEELFIGDAERIVGLYYRHYQDTQPAEEYKRISRHDYLEVGKSFPPIYCTKPLENEIQLWKKFIKKYPKFPATDDAYYRLIFRLVKEKKIKEARYFIKKYERLDFPDIDSTDMILKIKKLISQRKTSKSNFYFKIEDCEERSIF